MNNFKNLTLAIVASLGMVGVANADALSYDYVGAGVTYSDIGAYGAETVGATVNGSKSVGDNLFVFGSYSYGHEYELNIDYGLHQARFGIGTNVSVTNSTDLYGAVYGLYGSVVRDFDSEISNSWGYGGEVGVRSRFNDFEVKLGASRDQYNDFKLLGINFSDTYVVVGAAYHFTDSVAGTFDVKHNLDGRYDATAGVRFSF